MGRLENWILEIDFFKRIGKRRLLWTGLTLVLFGTFVKLSLELVEDSKVETLDRAILVAIAAFRRPGLTGPAVDFTALGSSTVLSLVVLAGVLVLGLKRDFRAATYLFAGGVGAALGTYGIKHLFARERPTVVPHLIEVTGLSYPSGHSLSSTSIYLLVLFLAWRHFRELNSRILLLAFTSVLIGGVCLSRLYLGVHYPSDVLSGFLFGAAWSCLLTTIYSP
jgi:undecaprenyl-diphosphatase